MLNYSYVLLVARFPETHSGYKQTVKHSTPMGRKVKWHEIKEVRLKAIWHISVSHNLKEFLLGALPSDDKAPALPPLPFCVLIFLWVKVTWAETGQSDLWAIFSSHSSESCSCCSCKAWGRTDRMRLIQLGKQQRPKLASWLDEWMDDYRGWVAYPAALRGCIVPWPHYASVYPSAS